MKILVTGADGFIGKNLISVLKTKKDLEILECNKETEKKELEGYLKECNFIIHLAGVNRPKSTEDFWNENYKFTCEIVDNLKLYKNYPPIIMSSSIQANMDNDYGKSKKEAEIALQQYSIETGANVFIYRLCNVFGKWSKPNYNSVVATFCNNIAKDLPIEIVNPENKLSLVYIDDVVKSFIDRLNENEEKKQQYYTIDNVYEVTVKELASIIKNFKNFNESLLIENMSDKLVKNLYSTYLSYISKENLCYPMKSHKDFRGSFTEILKSFDRGQVSINVSKPNVVKGNHWHKTKCEKFIVVYGQALIQLRKIGSREILDYHVSGEEIRIVEIPPGYTHNIINEGLGDLVTIIWCNECFDKENPDTYYEEVNIN